mgnify:FL=1
MNVINLIKQKLIKTPWAKYYKKEDLKLKVPDISMYEALKEGVLKYESRTAINYFGKKLSYREFLNLIDKAALAFRSQGVRRGDIVTICMPNTPEAMIAFYAINKIGAISNMIHPLSGEVEIKEYLTSTNSVMLVMIDVCYDKVKNIIKDTSVYKTIVVSARDSMPFFTGLGYQISQGFKIKGPTKSEAYLYWNDFLKKASGYNNLLDIKISRDDPAVILHSGGTTGKPKGIILSNGNFNALTEQAKIVFNDVEVGDRVLGIMPIFHGFGLGVSTIGPFILGCELIMVPQFNAKKFDKLLEKYKPNVIFGVPTLYEALAGTKNDYLDLSGLKYAISGGDSLSRNLIKRVNDYLSSHNAKIKISQGYGMTESLAAVALSYGEAYREDSIGIPFPGNYIKIVTPETQEEVPYGEDGEICISGPTVMLGYLDNEKETNEMLQIHKDGMIWLHTGDIGMMDSNGILYYKQRLKRLIISSGYNIYPSHIEEVIEGHPSVLKCSVIGIPHPYKVEVPKAFIVLKNDYNPLTVKASIKEYCKKNLASYAIPKEFEFRKSLPKTLIGKVDFKKLREEEVKNEEK